MTKQNGNGKDIRLVNTSELHRLTTLDRATIRQRLEDAGVTPKKELAREKIYDLAEVLPVLVRSLPPTQTYNEARTKKTSASALREMLKYQQELGEVVPIVDIRDYAYRFVKAMHDRFQLYARENKTRLHKEPSEDALEKTMQAGFSEIFLTLKKDYPKLF
jgi:hypothetical protein